MENKKLLNIAVVLSFYGVIMLFLFAFLYIIQGSFLSYHEDFMGITANDVEAFNPELLVLVGVFIRLIGFSLLFIGVADVIILLTWFRDGDKKGWFIQLMILVLLLIPFMILTGIVGIDKAPFIASVSVFIVSSIAQIIAAKPALSKKP